MANIQDWVTFLMDNHNMPNIPPSYASYARHAFGAVSTVRSYLLPLINQVSKKPDLATIALLLIIFLVSLKILNMLLNTILFWFRMAKSVVFWGGLVFLAIWMYTRGPEGAAQDVQYWFQVWTGEYQRWKEQERIARLMQQQQQHMGGGRQRWYQRG